MPHVQNSIISVTTSHYFFRWGVGGGEEAVFKVKDSKMGAREKTL